MADKRNVMRDETKPGPGLSDAAPHYHGHRERLRSRFREAGSEALCDYELLELVLFRALPRRDVKPLAKALIAKFGSFAEVIAASPQRLMEVSGLGETTITDFKVIEAAARRLLRLARSSGARCCHRGRPCSIIVVPRWPSPIANSSGCCFSTNAIS